VEEIQNVQGFDDKNNLNAKILVRNKAGENVTSDVPLYDAVGL
jgi:accessory colonization factor AcfC